MVDNQHRKITGYRELTEEDIAAMNDVKLAGETIKQLIDRVGATSGVDARCLAIARTELQTGFMWLTRAIAKPTSF